MTTYRMDFRIDPIVDYQMTDLEATAYKLCLLWMERSRDAFPNYSHSKFKKGDPRKSLIFRYCRKLVMETQTILDESEYPLYVRAQLEILKAIVMRDGSHPRIDASCLCGPPAWRRWKLWKKKYDSAVKTVSHGPVTASHNKVISALESTREFLVQIFDGQPSLQKMKEAVTNRNLFRWITVGKISPFYCVLSPWVAEVAPDLQKQVHFDLDIYRESLTEEVRAYFRDKFQG